MKTEHTNLKADSSPSAATSPDSADTIHRPLSGGIESPPGPPLRWGWRDGLYLAALVALVIAMAWRFTPNLTGEVAGEWWDPLLNIWTLSWDTTTLLHAPGHLWQAPLLYPNTLTLSYSENLLGDALLFAPVYLIGHNPVLAYNVTFYLTFLLCGVNMYIVARYYTGKRLAAFVAALVYAFAPYRLGQIDHIHVVAGEWIPLAFLYLDRALKDGRWRHWTLFTLFYLLQLLSSIYYGIFLSYALIAYTLIRYTIPFFKQLRQRKGAYLKEMLKQALKPVAAFLVLCGILVLLMAPYLASLRNGFGRSIEQTSRYSAFLRDFQFTTPFNWLYGTPAYNGTPLLYDSEHYLFLGWTTMVLALLGIFLMVRLRNTTMRAYCWTALIILLFAFGPVFQFSTGSGAPLIVGAVPPGAPPPPPYAPAIPMPWMLAYYILPGFKGLRVPARLIGVLLFILALLAAYSVSWLQEKLHQRVAEQRLPLQTDNPNLTVKRTSFTPISKWAMRIALVLIPCVLLLEAVPAYVPITHVPIGNQVPAVYRWLADHGGQQPIVELPMAHADENFRSNDEAWYDYYTIYHPHPIMNGWSGYRPATTFQISTLLLAFPANASIAMLQHYKILYVVLHLHLYSPADGQTLLAKMEVSPDIHRVATFGTDSVWEVN